MIEGRVEMMRSRRRQRKRRIIAVIVSVLVVAAALLIWRPWEVEEEPVRENGPDQVSELPEGDEPPDGLTLPDRYKVAVWHTPADASRLNEVEYQLAQLGQTEYASVPIAVTGTVRVNAVYYYGSDEELRSFAGQLTDRLGFDPPQRVDLCFVLGQDIEGLLAEAPKSAELPEGVAGLTVEVLNGSGIPGMASRTAQRLQGYGLVVSDFRNNDSFDCAETTIYCAPDKHEFALALKGVLGMPGKVHVFRNDLQVVLGGG